MKTDEYTVHQQLDARGLTCPEPIMLLHIKMRQLNDLDYLEVLATDPATLRDIPNFCRFLNHRLVLQQQNESTYLYHIQKIAKPI